MLNTEKLIIIKKMNDYNAKKRRNKKYNKKNKIYFIIIAILISICFAILIYLIYYNKKQNIYLINKNKELIKENIKYKAIIPDLNKPTGIKVLDNYIKFKNIVNNDTKYSKLEKCIFKSRERDLCLYQFLVPKKVIGKERKLIGNKKDGGYVLMDDLENISIAYSFGIDGEISFDAALAEKNIDIYMYDHTINSLPFNNPKFHWKKIGLSGNMDENKKLQTLEEILRDNGHLNETNMILKMDIDYSEWESLLNISDEILKKFKYLAIEYHFKFDELLYYKVLKKIQNTHQVFYLHCNNCGNIISFGNNRICDSLEVSYIIKENNQFVKDDSIYPIREFNFNNCNYTSLDLNLNLLKLYD